MKTAEKYFTPARNITRGFTIVELLMVIVIIAVLATISIVAYNGVQHRARSSEASVALSQAKKKLSLYRVDNDGKYPTTGNLSAAGISDKDVSYQYTSDGITYCITATAGHVAYNASHSTAPNEGACTGHTAPGAGGEGPTGYAIGDTGPGGGKVFYDKGDDSGGWRYLEAAPIGWNGGSDPSVVWGCEGVEISGARGTAIGTGKQNTAAIVANCGTAGIAARIATNYNGGGKSDWFLPSTEEMRQIYLQRSALSGLSSFYWSSTEDSGYFAWTPDFTSGSGYRQNSYFKALTAPVRPIRMF